MTVEVPEFIDENEIADYLPAQRAKTINAENLQLKEHQLAALKSLEEMRERHETIALLYHATGTGKTVTAVSDAKRFGKRTLFLAHTIELVNQAYETFFDDGKIFDEIYQG